VSADKDGKAGPRVAKPASKTVVGVPSLPVPPDRPSDLEMPRELPPTAPIAGPDDEQATALDVKAMSGAEAERVLAWTGFAQGEIPTAQSTPGPAQSAAPTPPRGPAVVGAVPKSPPRSNPSMNTKTPIGLPSAQPPRAMAPEKTTRPGVAPQPGISPKGRSTLLLDSSAPPTTTDSADASQERPPIVVPGTAAIPPNSVTQPPPWSEGAARITPPIPKGAPPPRDPRLPVEEISSSMLLPDASGEAPAAGGVEELSGSLLVEDAPEGKGPPVVTMPPVPGSRTPNVKPPVPRSGATKAVQPVPAAHRSSLGMPELPKTTPAPNLERLSGAGPNPSPSAASPKPAPVAAPAGGPASTPPPLPPTSTHPPTPTHPPAAAPQPIPPPDIEVAAWPPVAAQPGEPAPQPTAPGPSVAAPGVPVPHGPTTPVTGDIELTKLPRGGIAPALDAVKTALGKAREQLGPTYRKAREQLGPTYRKAHDWAVATFGKVRARLPPTSTFTAGESRPKWFLPAVAVAGLAVGIGLVAIIVSAVRGGGDTVRTPTARGSAPVGSVTALPPATPTAPATNAASAPLAPCTVSGTPHVIAPNATLTAGVEVVRAGDDIALGFAPTDHDALAARIDVASVETTATATARSRDVVRRVTPLATGRGALALAVDTDRKGDHLQGRRTVLADPAAQIGASGTHVAWARIGGAPAGDLWPLEEGSSVDALRGASEGAGADRTIALVFRRGSSIWMGAASGDGTLAPKGDLSHVEGLGTAIGSPAVAMSGSTVLVAWADRSSSDEPWRLRWTRFEAGGAPGATQTFTPPAGGKGEQAMSPGVAALPGGRFLLVWTEGPASGHDVRALTLGADGAAIGAPLVISNVGVNAGQGQAAVTAAGRGVVAFLESSGSGFQVAATPIVCP
jgi:hypothetical protein